MDAQEESGLGNALKAFHRGDIVREARQARRQYLHQRCCEASAQAAVLKAKTAELERANGVVGYTSAPERAGDETWEGGHTLETQGVRRRRRLCRRMLWLLERQVGMRQ